MSVGGLWVGIRRGGLAGRGIRGLRVWLGGREIPPEPEGPRSACDGFDSGQ